MKKRPDQLSIQKITLFGKEVRIFVWFHTKGETTEFFFKFIEKKEVPRGIPKSHLHLLQFMQWNEEGLGIEVNSNSPCWSIASLTKPGAIYPVTSVSWDQSPC